MLIVMRHGASDEEVRRVCDVIIEMGYQARPMPGRQRTTVGLVGNDGRVDGSRIEALSGVQEVIHVSKPYKQVSREWKAESTIVSLPGGLTIGGEDVVVMAGPCSVESEQQILAAAEAVREAGATVLARGGGVGLRERLKDFALVLGGYADAGVPHGREQTHAPLIIAAAQPLDLQDDLAVVRELERVAHQVGQHLSETQGVADDDLWHRGEGVADELDLLLDDGRAEGLGHGLEHVPDAERLLLELQLVGLDFREIEDVVEDAEQRPCRGVRHADELVCPVRQAALERELVHVDDRVHRRADLVAHHREERALGAVRRDRLLAGGDQVGVRRLQAADRIVERAPE